jgi:hypothetical protein
LILAEAVTHHRKSTMQDEVNPAHTFRVRAHVWNYATEVARQRGNFVRPSNVVNELIDAGLAVHAGREREQRR